MRLKKLFIATSNPGKLREMIPLAREMFGFPIAVEGIPPPLAEETGETFLENAWLKAEALDRALIGGQESDYAVLADDSGLEVDALGGRPGVRSARYAGDHVSPELHIEKLVQELAQTAMEPAKRTARYRCALALRFNSPTLTGDFSGEGSCEGRIGFEMKGASGFGYDPVFIVPEHNKTFGELSEDIKNVLSHRKRAFETLATALRSKGIAFHR